MDYFTIPVLNGALPRWDGGSIEGLFLEPFFIKTLENAGVGKEVFLCPFSSDSDSFYPIGVIGRIEDYQMKSFPQFGDEPYMYAKIVGRRRAKAGGFNVSPDGIIASGIEDMDIEKMSMEGYPIICGAGWIATGGYTQMKSASDITITIYGYDLQTGRKVGIQGEVNDLVPPEKAHTIEHGIIRSLKQYGLCTPKTLRNSLILEADELKKSVETGFKFKLPEAIGITSSGVCGNPMTNMAHFYLNREFFEGLKSGYDYVESLDKARKKTLSRLEKELEISGDRGLRVLQGLKKGMVHDDSQGDLITLEKVINCFPLNPWD